MSSYRYLGDGSGYLPGVPAQDLDDEDAVALAKAKGMTVKAFREHLEASGLYRARDAGSGGPASKARQVDAAKASPAPKKP